MARSGRPSKLASLDRKKFFQLIKQGIHPQIACDACGVNYFTMREWVRRGDGRDSKGRASNSELTQFAQEFNDAVAISQLNLVKGIHKASSKDWKAAAWMLERRFPEHWSNNRRINQQVEKKVENLLNNLMWLMSTQAYEELRQAIQKIEHLNLNPIQMTEMEALLVLLESEWLPKHIAEDVGKAYIKMKEAIRDNFENIN